MPAFFEQMPNAKAMAKYFPAAFLEVWPTVPAFVRAQFPYFTHVEVGFCCVRVWKLLLLSSYSSYVSKIFNKGWVSLLHACRSRILLREGVEAPAFVKLFELCEQDFQ